MIHYSSKLRSNQKEIMDDFEFQGDEMNALLSDLKRVNRWLGGNSVTIEGIKVLVGASRKVTILDVGCGDGEMLRVIAKYFDKRGIIARLIGIDANGHIIETARKRSLEFGQIEYQISDILNEDLANIEFDVALCTLFLHHFDNEQVEEILDKLLSHARLGVVINDLHRSRFAFVLFKFVSILLLRTKTARIDGLISIARGFKRHELKIVAQKLRKLCFIKWKWAFRYQMIIKKQHAG